MLLSACRQVKASTRLLPHIGGKMGTSVHAPYARGRAGTEKDRMSNSLQRLLPLFEHERARGEAMVLATVIHTAGATYTKPGAQMLIARSGEYAGLLSGGCLEGDLSERASRVLSSGVTEIVRYDARGPEDLLFGLGSGCEGAMEILLQRIDAATGWQPLQRLVDAWSARRPQRLLLVVRLGSCPPAPLSGSTLAEPAASNGENGTDSWVVGSGIFLDDGQPFGAAPAACAETLRRLPEGLPSGRGSRLLPQALPETDLLLLEQSAPPRILLLGAGPDALPVAQLVTFLGWSLVVLDHRSHYAKAARFERADTVLDGGPRALAELLQRGDGPVINAAIVMSHHLLTDMAYLRVLADSEIAYVGLLGPPSRRDRLLEELGGAAAARLRPRLHAPIGLDLGANTPEAIALSITAELQAVLAGDASMTPMSAKSNSAAASTASAVGKRA